MKLKLTLAALATSAVAANAAIIAQTSFEVADGFSNSGVANAINVTSLSDSSVWTTGAGTNNFNGIWTGDPNTGALSAVIGNAGQFLTVDAAGSAGVGTVEFSWNSFSNSSSGDLLVQWTTDALDGGESWTTVDTIALAAPAGYAARTATINQTGDVKVRWVIDAGGVNGVSIDDVTVNDFTAVPEPSSTALLGLGGLAMILRRRK